MKECKVILQNEAVTVVDYDGKSIQFPSVIGNPKTVFVKYENNRYSILTKEEYETEIIKSKKKTRGKTVVVKQAESKQVEPESKEPTQSEESPE